jgi:hypothetical protein
MGGENDSSQPSWEQGRSLSAIGGEMRLQKPCEECADLSLLRLQRLQTYPDETRQVKDASICPQGAFGSGMGDRVGIS